MTTISLKSFSGEVPNLPKYMLPDANAQQALFCDFAQKDLRPLRQGLEVMTMSNNIKGIYTEDGILFFTWAADTAAVKSPVIGEQYGRVYYMNAAGFRVTTVGLASATGGEPSNSWLVGVPTPTVAPALAVVERTALRGYTSTTVTAKAWYETNGVRYGEAAVTLTAGTAFKNYSFSAPARPGGTPSEAKLYAELKITGDGKDIVTVAVPAGSTAPARSSALPGGIEVLLSDSGAIVISWGVYETRAYTYTVLNTWLEESGPAPAATIDVTYMQDVTVGVTTPSFTGYRPYSTTKVYRTFGTAANYVSVASSASTPITDVTFKASDVGTSLPSLDWEPPPTGLFGLTALPNGVFAAFKDNRLYFSEPYRPHSWQYSMTFPLNIRGICAGSQSTVVTTAGGAYMVLGSLPKNMQQQLLPTPQAGISHRAMVLLEGAVAYASNDGIVLVNGSQATLDISQKFFSREDWRNRYADILADMRLSYHDGFVVATSSTQALGFIIRMDEALGTFSQFNEALDSAFYLPVLDTLYYAKGTKLYRFRGATTFYTADWWSKEFVLGKYVNFGAGYIRCQGPATITVYADGVQWAQVTTGTTGYFRLPAGKRALQWSFRIQTSSVVEELTFAESMGELRSV